MLGILFTMPQYSQGVLGSNAMGSGLRLLPLADGLGAGAFPAARVVRLVGAKVAVTAGFVLLAAGLFTGAMTGAGSSGLFVAAWMAVAGLGTGIAMATAMSAALVELSADKSGVGSAVLQAVNKIGGPFGIAVLGSVLSAGYLARLHLSGLPAAAAATVRQSVFGGVAGASKIGSASLPSSLGRPSCTAWTWRLWCPPASPWRASSSPWSSCRRRTPRRRRCSRAWTKTARLPENSQQSPVRPGERTMAKTPGGDSRLLRPGQDRAAGPASRKNAGSISPPKSWFR